MNLCQCTDPTSQIPSLVTAPPVKKKKTNKKQKNKTDLRGRVHHGAPKNHVQDINFHEF